MIKKLQFKLVLLLCALVAGVSSAWADDVTYSLTPNQESTGSNATTYITTLTEFTYNSVSWKMNQWNPSTLQIKTNQSSATSEFRFYNTSEFPGRIKQVVITFSALTVSDASKLMFLGGTSEVSTTTGGTAGTWNSTAKTLTWTPSGDFTYFAFYQNGKAASGTNKLAEENAIVVTYEDAASSPLASIAVDVSGATTVFHVGDTFTHEGAIVTATYEDATTMDVTADATFSTPDMTTTGTEPVTVSYTENGVEKTTSYNITVNAPATLTSISLSGTYPTEFTQGDAFSSEGIVVTANYDDNTTKDVTADATFSGYNMSTAGNQTVTVSYGGQTATYNITVNEYVQPEDITVNMNYEWLGSGNGSNLNSNQLPVVKTEDNVTITITDGTSTRPRGDEDYIRVYTGSTIKFEAPTGYCITSLVFTTGGKNTWTDPTVDSGTLSDKAWGGYASRVTFTLTGSCFIKSVGVTLSDDDVPVTVTSAGLATFACDAALDFSNVAGLEAYIATEGEGDVAIELHKKEKVPAGTGVLLRATDGGGKDYTVPVATGNLDDVTGNLFVRGTGIGVASVEGNDEFFNYILNEGENGLGFYQAYGQTVATNRAYLHIQGGPGETRLSIVFNDEAAGIAEIETMRTVENEKVYNLNGQRVSKATKGLYIINGKKVIRN